LPVRLDLDDPEQVARAAERVERLDLLINNAGVYTSASLLSGALGPIEQDMRTNYFGTVRVTRALLPALERRGPGAAVANVLSVLSLASMPALGGYAASKAAAHSFTQALRGELGKKGLRVHGIYPGPVDTDMVRAIDLPKTAPELVARAIFDGVERGAEEIFPDPMSLEVGAAYARSAKSVEQMFLSM
jgi:NAD(P)-dependent dehydrogenase (short-subunit alcohol dehydrogenase family)